MSKMKKVDKVEVATAPTPLAWSTVFDMPLDELKSRVGQAHGFMQQAVALFPGLYAMTDDERKYTNGRVRTGEGLQFLTLIDIMEAFPKFFEGLADLDQGVDPKQVETPLMRDRVQRAEILAKLLDDAAKLGALSDTVLHLRELVRDPMKEAYAISKVMQKSSDKLKSMLASVINYYADLAKASAATRKANADAAAAQKKAAAKG
jgi:hypothetical protein